MAVSTGLGCVIIAASAAAIRSWCEMKNESVHESVLCPFDRRCMSLSLGSSVINNNESVFAV